MTQTLQAFLENGVFAFILVFVRIGTAITIMPGVGDSMTPQNVRLYIALGLALVMTPVILPHMPSSVPQTGLLLALIAMEFVIGLFIGTVARILMAALDTAGMLISMASGLGNAQIFNPGLSTQGSLVGALLSISGVLVLFATNMHHLLFYGLAESYDLFPVGSVPDAGSMATLVAGALSRSFRVALQIAAPFLVVSLMVYVGMGVLARLMPQIQVFMLAVPLQILVSLITMALLVSGVFLFFVAQFEDGMMFFLRVSAPGGGAAP